MRILSINTTSRVMDVALSSNGKIFGIERDIRLNDYEGIVSLIKLILKRSRLKLEQIDYFGVCIGPGSFTGIRIGLSTMKALAYSTNKPLVGYKSLDLIAHMLKEEFSGLLCIMQDARRSNLYSAIFSNHRSLKKVSPYLLVEISQLIKQIKKLSKKREDLYFYGDMVSDYKDTIKKAFPNSIILNDRGNNSIGQAMISLTKDNIKKRKNSFELLPFYMYPKDCQVRRPNKPH